MHHFVDRNPRPRRPRPNSCARLGVVLFAATLSFAAVAQNEDVITVGDGGTAANCTRSTLESAIALAASIPGPNRIWLTRNTSNGYYLLNNAALIDNQDLEIVGGLDDCFDETPSGQTDISGSGGVSDPVFRIRGGGVVRLAYLTITLGDADSDEEAGGIDYKGHGSLELLHSRVEYNSNSATLAEGGGIHFVTDGGPAYLSLENTVVAHNSASDGGGVWANGFSDPNSQLVTVILGNNVRIEDNFARGSGGGMSIGFATLSMLGQANTVHRNEAIESGGGLSMYRSTAHIAATSVAPGIPLFLQNSASVGGAISAYGAPPPGGGLFIYSTTPNQPIVLASNHAESRGGALSVQVLTPACLKNVRLSANDAFIRGGAVDVDFSELHWNEGCDFPPASDVLCTAADGCNRIDHNVTTADRGIIDVNRDNSVAELSRVYLTDNTAGSAILIGGAASVPSNLILRDSVVARNNLAHVVHVRPGVIPQGDGITVAEGITVTGNNLSNNLSARVFNVPETAAFTLRNAIIDQPSRLLKLPFVGHVLQRVMTTASYSSAVTPTNDYFIAAPIFAGTVDDRYLQSPNSPGVDAAPAAGGLDIEGTPRDQDVPDVSNGPGPRDLGAFETASVLLFGNGFE